MLDLISVRFQFRVHVGVIAGKDLEVQARVAGGVDTGVVVEVDVGDYASVHVGIHVGVDVGVSVGVMDEKYTHVQHGNGFESTIGRSHKSGYRFKTSLAKEKKI